MNKLFFIIAVISSSVCAEVIEDYRFYQTDYIPAANKERFAAYILKSDPCIIVKMINSGEKTRYCKLGDNDLDLQRDTPSLYATQFDVGGGSVYFTAAAPWGEQRCRIEVYRKKISCKPTNQNQL
ncbi:hypothetical protein [Photobacterium nomapromontoriensis]|uniref:hypothetical protein n=1 Tax=Photobacterium nomapromontoriensis TaxID=2910237 RepID=UPI003D112020